MAEMKRDFSGAYRKVSAGLNLGRAAHRQSSKWAANMVRILKQSAADMKKAGRGRKTGQLARSVGMRVGEHGGSYQVFLGTGLHVGLPATRYARIQDEGGTIRMKDKMLTIPAPGVKGRISNYPGGFFMKTAKGNLVYFAPPSAKSGRIRTLKPLFLLRRQVTLPETAWFSGPVERQVGTLRLAMQPAELFRVAMKMAGSR